VSVAFRRVGSSNDHAGAIVRDATHNADIAAFPILADPVDVKKGDQLSETVSQPSIRPDKVDPPMGS